MNQTPESVPAAMMQSSGEVFERYERYQKLRGLTQQLNGLPDSAPLPEHVTIRSIELNYVIHGVPYLAAVSATELRVGDLYRLLAREIDNLVAEIREHAAAVRQSAATIEEGCTRAQYMANAQQNQGQV